MIKNYFKVAWRNLIRNKAFSLINILGLALGMACSLLIMLWIQDERSVDAFHANGKQLYQIYERNFFDGKIEANYPTQALLAEELKRVIPEIKNASSLEWNTTNTFEAGEKIDKMEGSFAGEDFFTMFSYPLLQGSAQSALNTLNGIAISRKMAEHFFGSPEKAIGKTIRYENYDDLQVTAVFENLSSNSSQQFDFLRSWLAFKKENNNWISNWGNTDAPTFVQLRKDADVSAVEAKIKDFVYRYKEKSKGFVIELALQPYTEKYLHSTFKNGQIAGGRIEYVRLFTLVALFILLIACVNFMNLATARSAKRAKEVGIRKVVGAARFALIGQFIGEAMLLTFFSFVIAIVITTACAKEISIRKILGASVSSVVASLSKEFIRLVVIAFIVAAPVAYWLMNMWLQNFAYRITMQWWMFLVSGILAIGIAFVTISFQAIKAAVANPVKSLRTE
jgi:putative ABC transport system permease protein